MMRLHEEYDIRQVTVDDHAVLEQALYQAMYVQPGTLPPDRTILRTPPFAKYFHQWGQKGDYGLVAYAQANHQPLGATWLRLFSHTNPGYGYIADTVPELTIALDPQYRGYGIGSQLLERLLSATDSMHAAISLSVDPANPAIQLYQRFGFTPVGTNGTSVTMLRKRPQSR